jgi:hypothetical protein
MPRSYRDIVAYGDFSLPMLTEGLFLRIGKDHKVEGILLGSASLRAATDFEAAGTVKAHETSTNHPLATPSTPGLMAATDKAKLNGLPLSADVLTKTGNLSDVSDKPTARSNLGLGSAAIANATEFEPRGITAAHAAGSGPGSHLPSGGISNSEIAGNAAIADSKINFAIPARISATYATGWNTPAGNDGVSFRKFANKMVQLSGVAAKSTSPNNNDLICTLPAICHPDSIVRFVIYGSSSLGMLVPAFLTVGTNGEVRLLLGGTTPAQFIAIPNNSIFFAAP